MKTRWDGNEMGKRRRSKDEKTGWERKRGKGRRRSEDKKRGGTKMKLTRASGSEGKECGGRSKSERSVLSGGVIRLPTGRIRFRGNWKEVFND